jgi:hypothetical protein
MTEIYKNTSHYVYFDIYNASATGTPTAVLTRPGSADSPLSVTLVVPTPTGVTQSWKAYIPLSETTVDDQVTVNWAATVGGESAVKVDYVEIITPYISAEELAARYNWSFTPGDANYRDREDVISAERTARYTINAYTNKYFNPIAKQVTAYGQNTDTLVLREPIISVSKLYENGALVIDGVNTSAFGWAVEVTETGQAIRIIDPNFTDLSESENLRVTIGGGGTFKQGFRYVIDGIFGFNYVPTDIVDATSMLVNDYMCRDALWRARYINKVEMRDWKFTYEKEAFRGTGNLIVDNLLKRYRDLGFFII